MPPWVERCAAWITLRLPQKQAIDPLFYLCALMLVSSLVLGGATRSGFLGDAVLALLAIPLLGLTIWKLFDAQVTQQMRWAIWFCLALVALPLLQLVPLPSWLWTLLPHREMSAESYALAGQDLPWMPLSVSPEATWLSALSLLPPLSLFVGVLLLGYRARRWLTLALLAVGVVGAFLGLLQVAQGPTSPLRFYQFTNLTEAVGFFANRNHFAALAYALILIAAAWTVNAGSTVNAALKGEKVDHSLNSWRACLRDNSRCLIGSSSDGSLPCGNRPHNGCPHWSALTRCGRSALGTQRRGNEPIDLRRRCNRGRVGDAICALPHI